MCRRRYWRAVSLPWTGLRWSHLRTQGKSLAVHFTIILVPISRGHATHAGSQVMSCHVVWCLEVVPVPPPPPTPHDDRPEFDPNITTLHGIGSYYGLNDVVWCLEVVLVPPLTTVQSLTQTTQTITTLHWTVKNYPTLPDWRKPLECTMQPGEVCTVNSSFPGLICSIFPFLSLHRCSPNWPPPCCWCPVHLPPLTLPSSFHESTFSLQQLGCLCLWCILWKFRDPALDGMWCCVCRWSIFLTVGGMRHWTSTQVSSSQHSSADNTMTSCCWHRRRQLLASSSAASWLPSTSISSFLCHSLHVCTSQTQ